MSHSEKTYGQTRGQTDYRADGQMERQTFFHRTLPAMSGCPTKETTKEVSDQTLLGNFKHCKSYLLEIGMIQGGQDVAYVRSEVRSSFLKLMIMITHVKIKQIPDLDIWSMLLSTGASYKLFKSLLWDVQRHVIDM